MFGWDSLLSTCNTSTCRVDMRGGAREVQNEQIIREVEGGQDRDADAAHGQMKVPDNAWAQGGHALNVEICERHLRS